MPVTTSNTKKISTTAKGEETRRCDEEGRRVCVRVTTYLHTYVHIDYYCCEATTTTTTSNKRFEQFNPLSYVRSSLIITRGLNSTFYCNDNGEPCTFIIAFVI